MKSVTRPASNSSKRFTLVFLICLSTFCTTVKASNPIIRHIFAAHPLGPRF